VLHPALAALQAAAAARDAARVLSDDAALGRALPPEAARASLAAGRHVLLSFQPPQAAKLLERLREAAAADPMSGHLATVFAVRGRTFHLPFLQVAGALLLAECVLGAEAAGVTVSAPRTIRMLQSALDRPAGGADVQLLAV
jgi:urease accessory protein UreF